MQSKGLSLSFWLLLISLSQCIRAEHEEALLLAVSDIPNLLSESELEQGPYNRVLDRVLPANVQVLYMPPGRAGRLFDKEKIHCLFPASLATIPNKDELVQSVSVNVTHAFLFSSLQNIEDNSWQPKLVAIRRGFLFGNVRQKLLAEFIELESDVLTLEFYRKKRVDAVVAYLSDMHSASLTLNMQVPAYNAKSPIHSVDEAFVCNQGRTASIFIKSLNERLMQLKDSGQLKRILEGHVQSPLVKPIR